MYPTLTNRSDVLKMLEEMIQIRQKILDSCATLAAEQLNDPVYPGTWSVLKNLAHLAWAENFMMSCVKCRPSAAEKSALTPEPALEPAAVRTGLDEAHANAIAFLKSNSESVLSEKCVFGKDQREETVGGLYFHIFEHEVGHRTFVLHKLRKLHDQR